MRQEGTTKDLTERLSLYLNRGRFETTTDEIVAKHLLNYLDEGVRAGRIPKYDGGSMIGHSLPYYIQDAFDDLRTSTDSDVARRRKKYEFIVRDKVPNLVELEGNNVQRTLAVMGVARLIRVVYGENEPFWVEEEIEKYLFAQDHVLQQQAHKFVVCCYRANLAQMLKESDYTAYSGTFGVTTLRTLETAGRVLFTFARPNEKSRYIHNEDSVTLIGESGDETGTRLGVQSVHTDFWTACVLISDVAANWPKDMSKLAKVFKQDRKLAVA